MPSEFIFLRSLTLSLPLSGVSEGSESSHDSVSEDLSVEEFLTREARVWSRSLLLVSVDQTIAAAGGDWGLLHFGDSSTTEALLDEAAIKINKRKCVTIVNDIRICYISMFCVINKIDLYLFFSFFIERLLKYSYFNTHISKDTTKGKNQITRLI